MHNDINRIMLAKRTRELLTQRRQSVSRGKPSDIPERTEEVRAMAAEQIRAAVKAGDERSAARKKAAEAPRPTASKRTTRTADLVGGVRE